VRRPGGIQELAHALLELLPVKLQGMLPQGSRVKDSFMNFKALYCLG
jgi:hypothetical protein